MDQQIPTNQPIETTNLSGFSYAGFWRRFIASVIDGIILFLVSIPVGMIVGKDIILSISSSAVVYIIYSSVFLCSDLMGTPGKAVMGMCVVNEKDQNRISFKSAIIRVLSGYISSFFLCIGYLIQPFTEKKQTFHDMVAGTVVIKKNPPEMNYFTAFGDSFKKIIGN